MAGHSVTVLLLLLALAQEVVKNALAQEVVQNALAQEVVKNALVQEVFNNNEDVELGPVLPLNRQTWLHGLVLPKLQCHGILLPPYHHAWVSLVGVVGFPQVTVAATPGEAVKAQKQAELQGRKNLAGWQVLSMPGGRDDNFTFLCFNTASRQMGEATLTVAIQNETTSRDDQNAVVPAIVLAPGYTSIWPLEANNGAGSVMPSLCFYLPVDRMGDILISVAPLDGEADLEVFDDSDKGCGMGDLLDSSKHVGPDVLELAPLAHGYGGLYIKVNGSGHTALTAGPRELGPLLAAGVPVAGSLTPRLDGAPACNKARLVVDSTNFTVVVTSEGGAPLQLEGALLTRPPDTDGWNVTRLPGGIGHDAALLIQAPAGERSKQAPVVVVSLDVCLGSRWGQQALYWLTATPDAAETTLLDGETMTMPRPRDLNWHLFRFRVSCGDHMLVTLSVHSREGVELMADSGIAAVHEQNCSSFQWVAEEQGSQSPVIRLTSDRRLKTSQVHLVRSKCPSYVYAAVRNVEPQSGGTTLDGADDLWWKVLATSSHGEKVLLEAEAVDESLDKGGQQIFRYEVDDQDSAVMFSITDLEGEVVFDVSASSDIPDDRNMTIKDAHVVVLLPPTVGPFKMARKLARDGRSPVLYMRVRSTSNSTSRFKAAARKHGDLQEIQVGGNASGAVKLLGYDPYFFQISKENIHDLLVVRVTVFMEPPTVFIGCDSNEHPQEGSADWYLRADRSEASIILDPASHQCQQGIFYLGVTTSNSSAYTLHVNLVTQLQDGVEQLGQVARGNRSIYALLPKDDEGPRNSPPLLIRAQAVTGSFGFCVVDVRKDLPGTAEDCRRLNPFANANLSAEGGDVMAAVDLEWPVPQIALLAYGFADESSFYVNVLVDSPNASTRITKGHTVVTDALVAPCCRANSTAPKYAIRRYGYNVPPAESASSVLLLELKGLGRNQLQDVLLQARETRGPPTPPYFSQQGGTVRVLRLMVDTARLARTESGDLWLEILVNATGQANFSLNITQFKKERSQQLPNRTVRNELDSMYSVDELILPNRSAPEALELRLQQCFGQVRTQVRGVAGLEGRDLDMVLPPSATSVLVAPASANASYEVELCGGLGQGPCQEEILLPEPALLTPRWYRGSISFVFGAATPVGGAEFEFLRYTLVAAKKNDGGANFFHLNASCGLRAALQGVQPLQSLPAEPVDGPVAGSASVFTATEVFTATQLSKPGHSDQLELALPREAVGLFRQEQGLWVNVLVTLQPHTAAAPEAKASYALYDLDPARKDLQLDARRPDASGLFGAIAIFIAFCACWSTVSRCRWCSRSAAPDQGAKDDDVELEVQYDLHHEVAMDPLPARSTYVPPTM